MNTLFHYTCSVGNGNKQDKTVILAGELTLEQIKPYLDEGMYFVPGQVGLEDLQTGGLASGSHEYVWHKIEEGDLTLTEQEPTIALTAAELLHTFEQVAWGKAGATSFLGKGQKTPVQTGAGERTILTLPGGVTLRSAGEEYELGAYVRFCDAHGKEIVYWDKQEWADEPELVMGAILAMLRDPTKRPELYLGKEQEEAILPHQGAFQRTIIEVEVLTDAPYDPQTLDQVAYDIIEGAASGQWNVVRQEAIDGLTMVGLLAAQGSDPEFFHLDGEGKNLDEEGADGILQQNGHDPALLEPKVTASCYSDDHVVEVEFNATPWFAQASDAELQALREEGYGGGYTADSVAEYAADYDPFVQAVFDHNQTLPSSVELRGFECHIDETEAEVWIARHRPHLLTGKEEEGPGK